ncbi:hypothetical protein ACFYSF_36030 [Streptomyces canus]|uniref:hypothetical protein n=1 Tax=Streptomyces canus TaxID=58343 RepID=UPI0036C4FBC4
MFGAPGKRRELVQLRALAHFGVRSAAGVAGTPMLATMACALTPLGRRTGSGSMPSPVSSPSVTPPHVAGRDAPRLRLVTALLCLARRRADVLFVMLRDGTFYEARSTTTA